MLSFSDCRREAEGIEIAFEVSKLAVRIKDALALAVGAVGSFDDSGGGAAIGRLGFRGHKNAGTRIKDASASAGDSRNRKGTKLTTEDTE